MNIQLTAFKVWMRTRVLLPCATIVLALSACSDDTTSSSVTFPDEPYRVGTITHDSDLPPEPKLPTDDQVCATLEASNTLVKRPDGALPPEADPAGRTPPAASAAAVNPDQARIQQALDDCGRAINAEVGAAIAQADADAVASQTAAGQWGVNIGGASGEELAKPQYRGSKFAVRLVVSSTGPGNSFISGPLTLPSGVTLWIDKGVTLFGTRDVMAYQPWSNKAPPGGPFCGNTAINGAKGSSGNCKGLINGNNLVNVAIMGDGSIDSRGYGEIVSSDGLFPLMRVDQSCTNTYAAYAQGLLAADGTACDNGGNFVNSKSSTRNMTWWDLAFLGNMVQNGTTGASSQSNFRMMVFNYVKNLTLYRITLNNSANFHVVPLGIDGLTVWGVKLQTPSLAAYANPVGNQNPLYTGALFDEDNVKNTDAFDPGSSSAPINSILTVSSTGDVVGPKMAFDGYLKNVVFAYNFVSTGDDDIVLKGSNNPSPADAGLPGVDGDRDVRTDRKHGIMIAHNHIYWGHGISIGSETNSGVKNVHVYDNSFDNSEEGLRIKSDYGRGGEVSNVYYDKICIRNALNALLFTPYYSTKAVTNPPRVPNFHDIFMSDVSIIGPTNVKLQGFQENSGGYTIPQYPLVMSLTNVASDSPESVALISSDANLTLRGVNLPILPSSATRVVVHGAATKAVDISKIVDCTYAFVDFPSTTSPNGTTWLP